MAITAPLVNISAAGIEETLSFSTKVSTDNVHAPVADTAATVTVTGDASRPVVISQIVCSYGGSGTLSGGNIKVDDGTNVFFNIDLASKDAYTFTFVPALASPSNTNLVVTLAAGGSNVTGKLFVNPYRLQ